MLLAPAASWRWVFFFMAKVYAFIDGFNFYHAVDFPAYRKFKWMNLKKLVGCYVFGLGYARRCRILHDARDLGRRKGC